MSCELCKASQEYQVNRFFCEGCIYCGARLIKLLPTSARRTVALQTWVKRGHSEIKIRELVKQKNLAIDPTLNTKRKK